MGEGHRITGVRAAAVLADLGFTAVASGVIARRRAVMGALERAQADRRTVGRIRRLRAEFGSGPVELVIPGRRFVIVLDPADVATVLAGTPTPFHPANREKRAALRQFQPHGVLVSDEPVRDERRACNEAVLDTDAPMHRLAGPFAAVVAEEAHEIIESALRRGHLTRRGSPRPGGDWSGGSHSATRPATTTRSPTSCGGCARPRTGRSWCRRDGGVANGSSIGCSGMSRTPVRTTWPGRWPGCRAAAPSIRWGRFRTGCSPSMPPEWRRAGRWPCWRPIRNSTPARSRTPPIPHTSACGRIYAPACRNRCGCGRPRR